jgi:hypothetical protein
MNPGFSGSFQANHNIRYPAGDFIQGDERQKKRGPSCSRLGNLGRTWEMYAFFKSRFELLDDPYPMPDDCGDFLEGCFIAGKTRRFRRQLPDVEAALIKIVTKFGGEPGFPDDE